MARESSCLRLQIHKKRIRWHVRVRQSVLRADGQIHGFGETALSMSQIRQPHLEDVQVDIVAHRFDPSQTIRNHKRLSIPLLRIRLFDRQ